MDRSLMNMQRDFNEISEKFRKGEFSLQTVSYLVTMIRNCANTLVEQELDLPLEIPMNVLQNDVEVINLGKWQNDNTRYFAENSHSYNPLYQKFNSGAFYLNDVYVVTSYVQHNFIKLGIDRDFLLRIPEVTLRDDVALVKGSNFMGSGRVFANYIDKAIQL